MGEKDFTSLKAERQKPIKPPPDAYRLQPCAERIGNERSPQIRSKNRLCDTTSRSITCASSRQSIYKQYQIVLKPDERHGHEKQEKEERYTSE